MESKRRAMCTNFSDVFTTVQSILDQNKETILSYMENILQSRDKGDVITIADFGTADGGNVIKTMNELIEFILERKGSQQPVNIILEDQCFNDFNALVKTVKGKRNKTGIATRNNIQVFFSATSMYEQCLQCESLDFGFCLYAVHWLSDWNLNIKHGITDIDADEDELAVIRKQAAKDWTVFMLSRGKELKSGGTLFVSTIVDGNTDLAVYISEIYRQMMKEGVVSKTEFENTNVEGFHRRTEEDFRQPFTNDDLAELGLELVSYDPFKLEVLPLKDSDIQEDFGENRADTLTKLTRGWLYNSLYEGLSGERSERERTAIVEDFFGRLKANILSDGFEFKYINSIANMVIRKH